MNPPRRMGYQVGLDGLRAVSVAGVLLYHAGFDWLHGGFLGVEVFFVVSGYLITSLLLEEWGASGAVSLGRFWKRRWRRLLPVLVVMLVAVCTWAALWGSDEQRVQLRRDVPWAVFYGANWGQIVGDVPYFSPSPPLLRHVWSLAVEEQWYVVWPLVFVGLTSWLVARRGWPVAKVGAWVALAALAVILFTAGATWLGEWDEGRQNFVYLSTVTRSSGLLAGAALAMVWRPWQVRTRPWGAQRAVLDVLGFAAVAVIVVAMLRSDLTEQITYRWWLPLVTLASTAAVAATVHPWATGVRAVLSWEPLAALGRRSYGVYVWSWPISRIAGAYEGSVARFGVAMAVTAAVSELSYRWVENPIRRGRWRPWLLALPRPERVRVLSAAGLGTLVLLGSLGVYYRDQPETFDAAADRTGNTADFDAGLAGLDPTEGTLGDPGNEPAGDPAVAPVTTVPGRPTTTVFRDTPGPPRLVVVGDSIADSLVVNAPPGFAKVFRLVNGAARGCSVFSDGYAVTPTGRNSFARCKNWERIWTAPVKRYRAKMALMVTGAWDVLDQRVGSKTLVFGTPEHDARLLAGYQRAVDALAEAGARTAVMEVMCMRPRKFWPERGEDWRVAHLNQVLRTLVERNPKRTVLIAAPPVFCADPDAPTRLRYRSDGVHFWRAGATIVYQAAAKPLIEFWKAPK